MDDSVKQMWLEYHQSIGVSENIISRSAVSDIEMIDRTIVDHSVKDESPPTPKFYHFCDNQKDADECAQLVKCGIKRATSSLQWAFENKGEKLPVAGDIFVITNWSGIAVCVIKITKVTIIPFNQFTIEHARKEGEGDMSFEYWKRVHVAFFENELKELGKAFEETMPVVFEEFEKVFS